MKRSVLVLLLVLALRSAAAQADLPAAVPSGRPTVGIALEGGGALGIAHVGVLQWIEEHRIPIDRVSGTSMGSLVGALYAAGTSPAQMRTIATSNAFLGVFTLQTPYAQLSFRRRQDSRDMPQALVFGLRHGVRLRNALLSDRGVNQFLEDNLLRANRADLNFNALPIPFRCIATDLNSLAPIPFSSGPIAVAVRASISIPGVFPPVANKDGHFLVDGGIVDNLPTDVLRRDLHAQIVLAVHLQDAPLVASDTSSAVGVLNRAFSAGITKNVEESLRLADVEIAVPVGKYSGSDYAKAAELIAVGYQAAESAKDRLLPYALSPADWQAYLDARNRRALPEPGRLLAAQVIGAPADVVAQVERDLRAAVGQPITPALLDARLQSIQSDGGYSAVYGLAAPRTVSEAPDTVLIRLQPSPIGPPFLLFGMDHIAETSNIFRSIIDLRLVDQNFGGYGSELRASARFGYLTDLRLEYSRRLGSAGWFVQPSTTVLRQPVYFWQNQKRVAERSQQDLGYGLEFGRTFDNRTQLWADWHTAQTRWRVVSGGEGGDYLRTSAQTALLHFTLDNTQSGTISPEGYRVQVSGGARYFLAGNRSTPLLRLDASRTRQWRQSNIFALGVEANSYLRNYVPEAYRFSLGGPLRLSASSFGEYRGTDTLLTRIAYLRRFAALPTGLGQGLYGVLSYECGQVWSPEQPYLVRQDGILGLLAATPIGAITFGGSVGDAGHRKLFFTIGRLF